MTNSRAKGARGEREARDIAREYLHASEAYRTQQFCGTNGDSDVSGVFDDCHVEVKRLKKIGVFRFLDQAMRDKRDGEFPMLMVKEDRGPWLICFRPQDAQKFVDGFIENLKREGLGDEE